VEIAAFRHAIEERAQRCEIIAADSNLAAVTTVSNSPASRTKRNKRMKAARKMTAKTTRRRKALPPLCSLRGEASG
jgi:hypothetical protein